MNIAFDTPILYSEILSLIRSARGSWDFNAEQAENAEIFRMNSALFAGLCDLRVENWAFFSRVDISNTRTASLLAVLVFSAAQARGV